jgi:uncharacterized protein YcbK (DUF882 family)
LHVPACIARKIVSRSILPRAAYRFGLTTLALLLGCENLQNAVAEGDTRTISLHHVHTNEDLTITYKRNGRYDEEALKKINWELRDWRRGEQIEMDPRLIDLVWDVQREVDAKSPIFIICGYRAPATNAMLRRRSGGVAQFSQHMLGKAMDFYIPGASLEQLRNIGLRLQRGGVGFYPTSGSPFVHLDVGSVRHWPTLSHDQLVRVFPNGRTVHIPSDGKPLPGYALALADIKNRGAEPSANSRMAARSAGVLVAAAEKPKLTLASAAPADTTASVTRAAAPVAAVSTIVESVPMPRSRPAAPVQVASAAPLPPKAAPAAPQPRAQQLASADISPWPLPTRVAPASPELAMAYAPQPGPEMNPRPSAVTRQALAAPTALPAAIPPATLVAVKQPVGKPALTAVAPTSLPAGASYNDPWLRAAITAPDLQHYMTISLMGEIDYRGLSAFMQRPSSSVMMAFSDEPNAGLSTDRFSGHAVVFVANALFTTRTASLQ